jgi:tetratricopeptide (TPR) repeat protein
MPEGQRCGHCGEELQARHRFCPGCGEPSPGAGSHVKRKDTRAPETVAKSVDDYLKAVSTFERMLHGSASNSVRSLMARGDALNALGEYESAVQSYRDALEIDSQNLEARLALGRLYNRLARYREAVRISDEVLAKKPANEEVQLIKARALLASGDFKGIVELTARARAAGVTSVALTRVGDLANRRYREVLQSSAVVQEVFVIHGSTRLLAHRSRLFRPQVDSDLVAGTLRAIQDFIQVALMAPDAGAPVLDELRYGAFIVLVESREFFQTAFVVSGTPDRAMRESFGRAADEIASRFKDVLQSWDGTLEHVRGIQEFLDDAFFRDLKEEEMEQELEVG